MANKAKTPQIPTALADVAYIDGPTSAAAGCMSLSAWHELVRKGEAPAAVIRQPRYTRWRLADVRQFLIERATQQTPEAAALVVGNARKASRMAREPAALAKAQATRAANKLSRAQGRHGVPA